MSEVQHYPQSAEQSGERAPWPDQIWIDFETGEQTVRPPQKDEYIFGNPEWPVAPYRDLIVETVANNPVTVLSSGTGNGKSIFVPQALYESGIIEDKIYITQPRIVAARENTQFIRLQMTEAGGEMFAGIVGYRTATEGDAEPSAKILQCTDGLVLQKMIDEGTITKRDLVIVDEAHEKNINITLIAAVAHKYDIPLLIMSATINAQATADHAAKARGLPYTPVINIPGRRFDVDERSGGAFSDVIAKYAQERKNELAFVPGARETAAAIGRTVRRVPNGYTLLTLNGDQTIEQQQQVFKEYPEGVEVVSTSVGQMGITVPNMDVVVDSGWERIGDYANGVFSLKVQPVSQATIIQRAGRVGRTKPGIYHQAELEGYPPLPRDHNGNLMLNSYDTPAIQRSDLSSAALRLARAGLTLDQLDLEDKPKAREIDDAHHKLVRLGAQLLHTVALTEIGEKMANVPLNPNYARMFVEAQKYTTDVQLHAAAMLSACQYEGITMTEKNMENWRHLTHENRSDMLVQLDIFVKSLGMDEANMNAFNIIQQRQLKAVAIYERLCADMGLNSSDISLPNEVERQALMACITSGSNKLFVGQGYGKYSDQAGFEGRLTMSTLIDTNPHLVMGTPFRLEHMRNSGVKGHNLVKDATIVTPEMLETLAPHRCSYHNEFLTVDPQGKVVVSRDLYFDDLPTRTATFIPAEQGEETRDLLLDKMFRDRRRFEDMSPTATDFYDELDRIRTLLIDFSDNGMQYEKTIGSILDSITQWEFTTKDIDALAENLEKKGILNWLKNTVAVDSLQAKQIYAKAPRFVDYEVGDEIIEVEVTYRNNEAYITVDPNHVPFLGGIEQELHGRSVHVKAASQRHIPLDQAREQYTGTNRAARRANRNV